MKIFLLAVLHTGLGILAALLVTVAVALIFVGLNTLIEKQHQK